MMNRAVVLLQVPMVNLWTIYSENEYVARLVTGESCWAKAQKTTLSTQMGATSVQRVLSRLSQGLRISHIIW